MSRLTSLFALVIIVGGSYYYWTNQSPTNPEPAAGTQITQLDAGAFGVLSSADGGALSDMAEGLGGGGAGAGSAKAVESVEDLTLAPIDPIDPWIPTLYEYSYTGDLPTLEPTVTVLRRDKTFDTASVDASGLLRNLSNGLFNSSAFQDLTVQSVQLAEDREYGYSFYISTTDGTVSINQNWQRWPQPDYENLDKNVEILADDKLIQLANAFVGKIGIDLTPYDEPQIDSKWRTYSDCDENNRCAYPPASISVIYPLVIEGQTVYEEYGSVSGLTISVDLAAKRVSGAWGLSTQRYDSSEYTTASADELKKAIQQGGRWPEWRPTEGEVENVQVTLGTPAQTLVKIWQWNEEDNAGVELFVPALAFPVMGISAGTEEWYNKKTVVIPLAAELLENDAPPVIILEDAVETTDDAPEIEVEALPTDSEEAAG